MSAPGFLNQIWQITRKEIKECIKSKRFIIFLLIFGAAYLIMAFIDSSDFWGPSIPPNVVVSNLYFLASLLFVVMAIVFAYDTISRERRSKSIDIVLSKPVMKYELVLGKFLGAVSTLVATVGIVHLAGYALSTGRSGEIPSLSQLGDFLAYIGIIFLGMTCYIALAMLFSVLLKSGSTSLIITLILSLFVLMMPYFMAFSIRFYNSPEVLEMINEGNVVGLSYQIDIGPTPWWENVLYALNPQNCMNCVIDILQGKGMASMSGEFTLGQSILAMFIFFAICLSLAIFIFQKKDLR